MRTPFSATGGRYRYGLFVERSTGAAEASLPAGSLVAVAVFSNARRWVKDGRRVSSYEWIRYASLPGIRVVGGMGKLLQAFIDEVQPDDVIGMIIEELSGRRGAKAAEAPKEEAPAAAEQTETAESEGKKGKRKLFGRKG